MNTQGSHWPLRLAGVMIIVGLATFAWMLLRAALTGIGDIDRHEVLDVIPHPSLSRHAVIFRHEHANSSSTAIGAWIIEGPAPDKGSREKPAGVPVAVWTEGFPLIAWQGDKLRLVGEPRPVTRDAARVASCDFSGGPPELRSGLMGSSLCLDPARATYVPLLR